MLTDELTDVILLRGDATTAYRDPAVVYHNGVFHLFCTLVRTRPGGPRLVVASSRSTNLRDWSEPVALTPEELRLNYYSPGNIVRHDGGWVMCLQTYPRRSTEKYADASARVVTMRSDDLLTWSEPSLLAVKGPQVPVEAMGRMIDPYLPADKDEPWKWWCLYKVTGVGRSWSTDLKTWHFAGHAEAGENACVIVDGNDYVLFHSPPNGIGVNRSADLASWTDAGLLTLGQADWPWARGRITAGFVLDLRADPHVGRALMFFHGTGPENEHVIFDTHACIGLAWSDDLKTWHWPGE